MIRIPEILNQDGKLPLEHPAREMLKIYAQRLMAFSVLVALNFVLLGIGLLVVRLPTLLRQSAESCASLPLSLLIVVSSVAFILVILNSAIAHRLPGQVEMPRPYPAIDGRVSKGGCLIFFVIIGLVVLLLIAFIVLRSLIGKSL